MNRFVLHIILMLSVLSLNGQNLIYNGSFEEYYSCPVGNDLNDGQLEKCKGWWKPTMGTSDYFNSCNNLIVGIPHNFWGFQEAFQGDGYVGFGAISWNNNGYNSSEYIRTKLISSLKPCVGYKFSMYVNLANKSTHGIGKIGAWFSVENDFNPIWTALIQSPQIIYKGLPISDTVNWTKIEGTFIADGFEKYLTIGYFQDNVYMDTVFIQDWGAGAGYAPYYHVDSVSLIELNEVSSQPCSSNAFNIPNVITSNNDGINDVLDLSYMLDIVTEIKILNRWGNVVARLNKDNPTWDGENCTEGTYYYYLDYKIGNKTKQKNGFIQLVR